MNSTLPSNGLIYIRGQPEDFDHWAQLGNRGWSWDDCPALLSSRPSAGRAETPRCAARAVRCLPRRWTGQPLCAAVIEAGKELGLEYREDVNDLPPGAGDSIGWCQQTRGGRRRASAARTYLQPALKRPNLQLITNALVHRVDLRAANAPPASNSPAAAPVESARRRARGDPVGRRGRLTAHPAALRCRRSPSIWPKSACPSCTHCAASGATCRITIPRACPIGSSAWRPLNEQVRGIPLAMRARCAGCSPARAC